MYHAFFRLLPYQYNPSLGCFRKCHSLAPHERQTNSVILLNNGQHFITSTKFSIYRKVIDGIVDLFKETKKNERCEVELKFKGKIIRTTNRGSQQEILRKKTYKKNNNKSRIKLSEAILSTLGDFWETFICSSLPARLMEEFPKGGFLTPRVLLTFVLVNTFV